MEAVTRSAERDSPFGYSLRGALVTTLPVAVRLFEIDMALLVAKEISLGFRLQG